MAEAETLTAEQARQLLEYDRETGLFYWLPRPQSMFKTNREFKRWNARFSGNVAGGPDGHGYVAIGIFYRVYLAHRVAWLIVTGEWPSNEIDHINLDRGDNRWSNLRESTASQNGANKRARSDNSSGFKGVSFSKRSGKWYARIRKNGVHIYLGQFDAPEEAHKAYISAAVRLHGEYARAS